MRPSTKCQDKDRKYLSDTNSNFLSIYKMCYNFEETFSKTKWTIFNFSQFWLLWYQQNSNFHPLKLAQIKIMKVSNAKVIIILAFNFGQNCAFWQLEKGLNS